MGINLVEGVKEINHAQFLDDTIFIGGASTIMVQRFKETLNTFYKVSGSKVNKEKIVCIPGTSQLWKNPI